MYRMNRIGPSTEPCGTPYLILLSFEDALLLETYCFLLLSYEVNKDKIRPLKPYLHNMFNKML